MVLVITSNGLDRAICAQLQTGESPLLVASWRIPKQFTTATSWLGIIAIVRLFDEFNNLFKMRKFRRQFQSIDFPIARRTKVCVTDRHILIWKESAFRLSPRFLGSVDLRRVKSSHVTPSTHVNWKVLTIQLKEGRQVRFLTAIESAVPLSDALNASAKA